MLYSLLSIHISSNSAELQCKAAERGFSVSLALGEKKGLCLSSVVVAWQLQKGFFLSSFTGVLVCNMKSTVLKTKQKTNPQNNLREQELSTVPAT